MELLWKEQELDRICAHTRAQIPVEGDVPLPEGRGCTAVLCAGAEIKELCCARAEGALRLQGCIELYLLCEEGEEIYAFTSRASFSSLQEGCVGEARCTAMPSEVSVSLQNGVPRFTAVVEADIVCLAHTPLRSLAGVRGLADMQRRDVDVRTSRRARVGGGTVRIREEAALPGVAAVLLAQGEAQLQSVQCAQGRIALEGVLCFSALVRNGAGTLSCCVQSIPFRAELEGDAMGAPTGLCALRELNVRSVGEEFGLLAVEATLCVDLYAEESSQWRLCADAYAPSLPFRCLCAEAEAVRESSVELRRALLETLAIPEGMPEAAQVIYACAQPNVTDAGAGEGKLTVEGILDVRVVYQSAGGARYAFASELPFSLQGAGVGTLVQLCAGAPVCASGTGRTLELKGTLWARSLLYDVERVRYVEGIEECAGQKQPAGVLICFAGGGETLYDVAKRCGVLPEAIQAQERDLARTLAEGERVVVVV